MTYREQSEKQRLAEPAAADATGTKDQQNIPGYFIPRKRLLWCLAIGAVLVAIALGVGLGVGLTRGNSEKYVAESLMLQ